MLQRWEGYFENVIGYRLQVTYLKCNKFCNYFNYFIKVM